MSSIADKIALLTNPTPAYLDPEDDVNIETAAKVEKPPKGNNDKVLFSRSELRSKAAVLLDDSDPAFVGKKVSRKTIDEIFHDDSREKLSSDEEEEEEDEDYDEDDDDDIQNFKSSLAAKAHSEEESEMDEESMESDESNDDFDADMGENTADMVNQFSHIDVTNEMERGSAVKDQLEIINKLCESRIRLHKLLTIAHTLPQKDSWNAAKENGGKEIIECMNKASTAAESILNSCLDFQLDYFNRINDNQKSETFNDEEIPSDTDEEIEKSKEKDVKKTPKINRISKRKLKSHEYADLLDNHLKDLLPYRNSVLQIWDEKTKLSSGKLTQKSFSGFESSVIKQIEQILQDKDRLIKRTQLKRSVYRVMGKTDISDNEKDKPAENTEPVSRRDMLLKDYDPEIFDDDDFYRQFLNDVIQSKSVGIDPISLRKQMEIQNVRSKIKRKVDTKASKGRKIRYDIDPKLVNFAIAEPSEADEDREIILNQLCGGYNCSS